MKGSKFKAVACHEILKLIYNINCRRLNLFLISARSITWMGENNILLVEINTCFMCSIIWIGTQPYLIGSSSWWASCILEESMQVVIFCFYDFLFLCVVNNILTTTCLLLRLLILIMVIFLRLTILVVNNKFNHLQVFLHT